MIRKNVVCRMVPAYPVATLYLCLLTAAIGSNLAVQAVEPSLPDVNLSAAPANQGSNPVLQLPPAPAEAAATATSSAASDIDPQATTPAPSPEPIPVATTPVITSTPDVPGQPKARNGESLRALAKRLNLALPLAKGRIVVTKSQRRLDLYSGNVLLKSYHVALGSNPIGHKKRQGDGRTPEGQFYICTRNSRTSAFHIFLGLSYPALPDATRAVKNKAISPRQFQIIRQRLASRGAPLWETRLGGWVGIHGGTDAPFSWRSIKPRKSNDWTAGCVAVTNREIEELHAATRIGTPVLVQP